MPVLSRISPLRCSMRAVSKLSCFVVALLLASVLVPEAQAGDGLFARLRRRACKTQCVQPSTCQQSCTAPKVRYQVNSCGQCVQVLDARIYGKCVYPICPTDQDCTNARKNCCLANGLPENCDSIACTACFLACQLSAAVCPDNVRRTPCGCN